MNEENITATSFCELLKENKLLLQYNQDLIKENKQLQNNWNELKKWLEEIDKTLCKTMIRDNSEFYHFQRGEIMFLRNIKLKMQELEQWKDESN